MNFNKFINSDYLKENPLCGIDTYKDELNLTTGECTRRIKKLVLTGQERWYSSSKYAGSMFAYLSQFPEIVARSPIYCSHLIGIDDILQYQRGTCIVDDISVNLWLFPGSTTPDTLKRYLAAQYANGTPVTVWYVLATPITEVITVPSGLSGTVEGYLNQSDAPTSTNPIYPTANTVEQWVDLNYYIMGTSTDTITTLPAVLYPTGTTATVGLKGQAVQSGTPPPDNPIQPQGTGERTGNLFDESTIEVGGLDVNTGAEVANSSRRRSGFIKVTPSTAYTLVRVIDITKSNLWVIGYDANKNVISDSTGTRPTVLTSIGENSAGSTFDTTPSTEYLRWYVTANGSYSNIMLNTGSTALPYEPYGIKIPISSASTTTPVYLGEVQSTRRIKKLVLTGEETSWHMTNGFVYTDDIQPDYLRSTEITLICSHYRAIGGVGDGAQVQNGQCALYRYNGVQRLYIRDNNFATLSDFKSYLAQQYSAGTPVCVWYVLAEPETGIVNEPLMKIGEYADEISGISIPVTAGGDTLSVGTTVQPSEATVGYKGWHPVQSVHVYPDSSWMPTSWEEFRKAVRSGKAQSLYPVGTKLYESWGDDTSNAWIIVDYPTGEDYLDSDLAQQGYTNRVMLMEEKLNYLRQFDAIEAWLYVETAIPAGTYRFTIPNYDASYGGNKTYIFTSTANVPVGGQLTLTWAYQQNPSAVQAYSSSTATSTLFNVSIAEWDGTTPCTDLGTIKLAMSDADSTYGKLNHIHRARYGSNNYAQSGIRQWFNSDAAANAWWQPTTIFDRPYGNRNTAGRLNTMDNDMKSIIATPTINCITNNLFESSSLDGTTFALQTAYTIQDKLFPVTHTEVNLSSTPNVDSVLGQYIGADNADRIKYRADNGNAYYWWLRTPSPPHALRVRHVNTSGALSYTNASGTLGSAAACIIQ